MATGCMTSCPHGPSAVYLATGPAARQVLRLPPLRRHPWDVVHLFPRDVASALPTPGVTQPDEAPRASLRLCAVWRRHSPGRESDELRRPAGRGPPVANLGDLRASRSPTRARGRCPRESPPDQLPCLGGGHLRRSRTVGPGPHRRPVRSHRASGSVAPHTVALAWIPLLPQRRSSLAPSQALVLPVPRWAGAVPAGSCGSLCCGASLPSGGVLDIAFRSRSCVHAAAHARALLPRSCRSDTAASAATRSSPMIHSSAIRGRILCTISTLGGIAGPRPPWVACCRRNVSWSGPAIPGASRSYYCGTLAVGSSSGRSRSLGISASGGTRSMSG